MWIKLFLEDTGDPYDREEYMPLNLFNPLLKFHKKCHISNYEDATTGSPRKKPSEKGLQKFLLITNQSGKCFWLTKANYPPGTTNQKPASAWNFF